MNTELLTLFASLAPAAISVISIVISVIMSIKKLTSMISEFKQSNELKNNNDMIKQLLEDNKSLKKLNERLLVELTKIKPAGWTDDQSEN